MWCRLSLSLSVVYHGHPVAAPPWFACDLRWLYVQGGAGLILSTIHHFCAPCWLLFSNVLCPNDEENHCLISRSARATAPAGTTVCSYAAYRRLQGCSSRCLSCCSVFGEQLQISGCWFHYAQAVIRRMKNWDFKRHTRHSWRFGVSSRSLSYHPMKLNLASETCSRWT